MKSLLTDKVMHRSARGLLNMGQVVGAGAALKSFTSGKNAAGAGTVVLVSLLSLIAKNNLHKK